MKVKTPRKHNAALGLSDIPTRKAKLGIHFKNKQPPLLDGDLMKELYEAGHGDVEFAVGSDQQPDQLRSIKAYKIVLASKSPVFRAMFYGPLKEDGMVRVPDCEPDSFDQVLRYLYTGKAAFAADLLMPALWISKKYMLNELSEKLVRWSCQLFTDRPDQVPILLESALSWRHEELAQYFMSHLYSNFRYTSVSDSFVANCSKELLERIVSCNSVKVRKEADLFRVVTRWIDMQHEPDMSGRSTRNSPKGAAYRSLLYNIRYTVMTRSEIQEVVAPTNLLPHSTVKTLLEYVTRKGGASTSRRVTRSRSNILQLPKHLQHLRDVQARGPTAHIADLTTVRPWEGLSYRDGNKPTIKIRTKTTISIVCILMQHDLLRDSYWDSGTSVVSILSSNSEVYRARVSSNLSAHCSDEMDRTLFPQNSAERNHIATRFLQKRIMLIPGEYTLSLSGSSILRLDGNTWPSYNPPTEEESKQIEKNNLVRVVGGKQGVPNTSGGWKEFPGGLQILECKRVVGADLGKQKSLEDYLFTQTTIKEPFLKLGYYVWDV